MYLFPPPPIVICFVFIACLTFLLRHMKQALLYRKLLLFHISTSSGTKKIFYNLSLTTLDQQLLCEKTGEFSGENCPPLSLPVLECHLLVEECNSRLYTKAILAQVKTFVVGLQRMSYYNCLILVKKLKPRHLKELAYSHVKLSFKDKLKLLLEFSTFYICFCFVLCILGKSCISPVPNMVMNMAYMFT